MARTPISVQGLFTDADGGPSSGYVCATPDAVFTNDGAVFPIRPVCGMLDPLGYVRAQSLHALEVLATDDTGTTPDGEGYTFLLELDGQPVVEFHAPVPAASTATDHGAALLLGSAVVVLTSLVPAAAMVGQAISGAGVPGGATVAEFDDVLNTVTMSAPATSGGIVAVTIGGAVTVAVLIEAAG